MTLSRSFAALGVTAAVTLGAWTAAHAVNPEEQLTNPKLEARARSISRELRCVVCQSQPIDDSSAPVAQALRKLVRARLVAGDNDRQVIAAVTARYGDFVLLKPRLSPETAVLWLGPFLVLGLAGFGAVRYVQSQGRAEDLSEPLTEEEHRDLSRALEDRAS